MILLSVALAITPAFKMRFWNIGAEGQILVGGIATAAVMRYFGASFSPAVLFIVMIICSIAAGADFHQFRNLFFFQMQVF